MDRKKKKGWQLLLAGFTSLFFSVSKSYAQKKVINESMNSGLLLKNTNSETSNLQEVERTIKGKILNTEQEAILNAYVLDPVNMNKVLVNKDGQFVMQLPADIKNVLAGAIGFDSRMVPVSMLNSSDIGITLNNADTTIKDTSGIGNLDLSGKNIFMGGITTFTEVNKPDTITTIVKKVFNNGFFKVSPNPASKSGVYITVKKTGIYTVQIFDNNSKLVHVTEILIDTDGQVVHIDFPDCIKHGTFFIRLIEKRTQKQYTDKIIVE